LPIMDVLRDDAEGDPPDKPVGDGPGQSHLRIVK
jgi:hypothetical protein